MVIIASVNLLALRVGRFMFAKEYLELEAVAKSEVGRITVFVASSPFDVIGVIFFNSFLLLSYDFISIIALNRVFIRVSFTFLIYSISM
jgi:hypothetical protein